MAVGSRVEHAKHGLGTVRSSTKPHPNPNPNPSPNPNPNQVSSAIGASKKDPVHADGTPLGVLVDFDNGETHP